MTAMVWSDKIRRLITDNLMPEYESPPTPRTPKFMWFDQVNYRPVYVYRVVGMRELQELRVMK